MSNAEYQDYSTGDYEVLKKSLLENAMPSVKYSDGAGQWYNFPGGGRVGVRISTIAGETVDVELPNLPTRLKVHHR